MVCTDPNRGGQVDYIPDFNLYGLPLDSLIFYVQNSTGFKSANGTHVRRCDISWCPYHTLCGAGPQRFISLAMPRR